MSHQRGSAMFRILLFLYPAEFRDEYGREMALALADRYRHAANFGERLMLILEAISGILRHAPKEHLSMLLRDLRYSLRLLRKSPAFTVTAILSLALGIGANAAIFAVAKLVLFDTLPVKNPGQLRMLTWVSPGPRLPVPPVWGDVGQTDEGGFTSPAFSYPVWQELRKKTDVFAQLIAFKDLEITVTTAGQPEATLTEMLSGDAFTSLGILPVLGRTLISSDDGNRAPPVAVISEDYWAEKFGRSSSAVGGIISLNGAPVTVVGVAPGTFSGLTIGSRARVFFPLTLQPLVAPRAQITSAPNKQAGDGSLLNNPQSWWVQILARLRSDVPEAQLQASLDLVLRRTAKATLRDPGDLSHFHLKLKPGDRGADDLATFAKPSYILLSLAAMVLLLACVNLANLLLARAASRQREIVTRLALGAGRAVIIRQLLTESLLLSAIGGSAGLFLGYLGRNIISGLIAESWHRQGLIVNFDWVVLTFTAALSFVVSIAFGAVPAWQTMRMDLKDAAHSTADRRKVSLGKALVVSQVALSTILLMGSGLFVRTLINLSHTEPGFKTDHMLIFKINPPRARYTDQKMAALYAQLQAKLAAIPGVRSVTLSIIALIGDGNSGSTFHVSGSPVPTIQERIQTNGVANNFFQTMGIPILAGRAFDAHDSANSVKVAVVNRALVRRYFPSSNPIGQTFDAEDSDGLIQVIGVAADTRHANLRTEAPPTFFVPYQQSDMPSRMMFQIRTVLEPFGVLSQARAAVRSLDRDLPLIGLRTQEQQISATLSGERIFSQVTSSFGLVALVLASIGVYGLMAYTVALRRAEIGIRMALGARVQQVLATVLGEVLWIAITGLALGLLVSVWLAHFIGSMLYGLKGYDPLTACGTILILLSIALLAGMGPARRASQVDPVSALRHE